MNEEVKKFTDKVEQTVDELKKKYPIEDNFKNEPASDEEVKKATKEINPDKNSMDDQRG